MKIIDLRVNHLENPLGYAIGRPNFSWVVEESTGKRQAAARVEIAEDEDFRQVCFDSGRREELCSLSYTPDVALKPRTRYFWRVSVWADDGDAGVSPAAWFETAKMGERWEGEWIESPFAKEIHPVFTKKFTLIKPVAFARCYITGLGIYELSLNGKKAGEEYLAPFYNDYNNWVQYQVYDVTQLLREGENQAEAMLGNGWYKGRFGFVPEMAEVYGDSFHLLCELRITYTDGETVCIGSGPDWLCHGAPVVSSSIYDGEVYDARLEEKREPQRQALADRKNPGDPAERMSPPLTIRERRKPVEVLHTPAGEQVLDFGQVMTGWVEFSCDLPEGKEVKLQFGELLQHDNFYNDNLRTAKEEYTYLSAGRPAVVRPHFTFYGFRFVKVTGMEKVNPEDFTACVIHSELAFTGKIETSNQKVNRLFQNALWGQRGNFVDVPTDCPQRDERMGWTGDAQVFAATASFNMYTPAFYAKFLRDMLMEQRELGGAVPHVVPDVLDQIAKLRGKPQNEYASCAWADSATVIPWAMYLFYGDKAALEAQYENMKLWVEYIKKQDETQCGGRRLWTCGFHFADWLALDNPEKGSCFGRTDPYFVASSYYYYSATLTAKAAGALGKTEDKAYYEGLAAEIKEAIRQEYFTSTGRLAVDTQTALVLALYMDFVPPEYKERTVKELKRRLDAKNKHLDTGFVGTAYLCPTLSQNGLTDYAYTLLLNEDFPSWLYEINMGATTVWERWNSVLPDGLVSDTGMNSMNHYAYGAVAEWMYRYMCGLNPREDCPGFKEAVIAPQPDDRFDYARAEYRSASGLYRAGWEKAGDGIRYHVEIPFDAKAEFVLPWTAKKATVNSLDCPALCADGRVRLEKGSYDIYAE